MLTPLKAKTIMVWFCTSVELVSVPETVPGGGQNIAANIMNGGNAIVTFRATARLRLPDGKFSDMRRTVGAQVKFVPFASAESPFYVLRWYDTAWSY